jgi:hypothetical protein
MVFMMLGATEHPRAQWHEKRPVDGKPKDTPLAHQKLFPGKEPTSPAGCGCTRASLRCAPGNLPGLRVPQSHTPATQPHPTCFRMDEGKKDLEPKKKKKKKKRTNSEVWKLKSVLRKCAIWVMACLTI